MAPPTLNPTPGPSLSSPALAARTPQQKHPDLNGSGGVSVSDFSLSVAGAAQESYVWGPPRNGLEIPAVGAGGVSDAEYQFDTGAGAGSGGKVDLFSYMPETHNSPNAVGRWEGRHGEIGQMDAEWLLSLCEGDGFSLQMLNEMMRFEPSLGA